MELKRGLFQFYKKKKKKKKRKTYFFQQTTRKGKTKKAYVSLIDF